MRKVNCTSYFTCIFILLFTAIGGTAQTLVPTGNVVLCPSRILTVTGAPPGATYQWQLNGGDIAGQTASSYTAVSAGTYTVVVNGTLLPGQVTATLGTPPVPDFGFTTGVCSGSAVSFTGSATSGLPGYTYSWDFGDGGTANTQNPLHVFNSLGCGTASFNVTLTVTDANQCTGTITKTVTVKQAPDVQVQDQDLFTPFSNCDHFPTPGNPQFVLTINNISPSAGCITEYYLNWGDGAIDTITGAGFPRSHTYNQLGGFDLLVTAVGSNGCRNSKLYQVANQTNPDVGLGTLGSLAGCDSVRVGLVISLWYNNSPGTTYLLNYGDGTSVTLNHPINGTNTDEVIYHTYANSACPGAPGFQPKITARNYCRDNVVIGPGIQVWKKPVPGFAMQPSPGCSNRVVNFINQSIAGVYDNCSTTTLYSWNFGDPASGVNNTSTLANPSHIFSAPGVYTITLSTTNGCGTVSLQKDICITAPPVALFNTDTASICVSGAVHTINNSVTGSCSGVKYNWSVSYTPAFCGASGSWVFEPGSTDSSLNPVFIFNNPGTYTITLSITGPCPTVSATKTINVKKPPVVALPVIPVAFCDSAVICPVPAVQLCGTGLPVYAWSIDGVPVSNVLNPGCFTVNTAGLHILKLNVTNECGTTTALQNFTINPAPDLSLNIPNPRTYCPGDATGDFIFSSTTAGAVISWTNSNTGIGLAASGNGNISSFAATNGTASPITATITVKAAANGCTKQSVFIITVNPKPAIPTTLNNPVNYCRNDVAVPLTATALPGHSLQWYASAAGGPGSATAPTPSTATVGTTVYYVSQVNDITHCESGRLAITVNVFAVPNIGGSGILQPTACGAANGSITLTGLLPSTSYIVRYLKNGNPQTATLTSDASGNIIINGLNAGTYDNVQVTLNGCVSNAVGQFVLADPNPPATPTAGVNTPVCAGVPLNFTASSATPGAVYSWNGPAGFSSSQQNPSIAAPTPAQSGAYSVTASLNGCTSSPAILNVVIYARPAAPTAASPVNVCANDTIRLQGSSGFPGGLTYLWTGPNGFSSSQQNPVIPNANASMSGIYTLVVTSVTGNCSSPATPVTVTVLPLPFISDSAFTNPVNCNTATGSISLLGLQPATTYTVRYTKDAGAPQVVTLVSNASGSIMINNLAAGTYSNIQVSLNGCLSNIVGPFILADPNPPAVPAAGSNSPVCAGQTISFTASSATSGTSYSWTGPGSFSSTLQNPAINNATAANNGTYSVIAIKNGCRSAAAQVIVLVNAVPGAPNAASPVNVCTNDTIRLQGNSAFPGGVTYSWMGPNGFTSSQQNPQIPNAGAAMSGIYNLTVTSIIGNCTSAATPVTVNVLPLPFISSSSHVDPVGCNTATGSIVLNGLQPLTVYTVRYVRNGGAAVFIVVTTNSAGTILFGNLPAGAYAVSVSLNGCLSNTVNFILRDTAPFSVDAGTGGEICAGGNLLLSTSITTSGSATYLWTGPNGFSSVQQNPIINNAGVAYNGTFYVAVTVNGCTALDSVTASISARPVSGHAGPGATVCKGKNSGVINLTGYLGHILRWEFSLNNGATWGTVVNNTASLLYNDLTVDHWYRAVVQNGVCPFVYSDTAKIFAIKGVESVSLNRPSFETCTHDTAVTFTATPVYTGAGPVSYFWYVNGQLLNNGNSFALNIHVPAAYTTDSLINIKVLAENSFGCGDSAFTAITIHPFPNLSVKKRNDITCAAGNAILELSGGVQYQWAPDAFTRFIDSLDVLLVNPNASTVYRIRSISAFGCISKDTAVQVRVDHSLPTNNYLMPSAFTPNGDGVNDDIGVNVRALLNTDDFELRIFNRWGVLVFETTDPAKHWNGYYNKKLIPDTYVYYLRANTVCGLKGKLLKGTIILAL